MDMTNRLFQHLTIVSLILCARIADSQVVVNEVMANEPGSSVTLEWIELYNAGGSAVPMADFRLDAGGSNVEFSSSLVLDSGQYLIVCRRLIRKGTSPGFEDKWGDSSGVWGDSPFEQNLLTPVESSFSLRNAGDAVRLYYADSLVSEFIWRASCKDGISWERVAPDSDSIVQSVAPSGSTPGEPRYQAEVTIGAIITRATFIRDVHGGPFLSVYLDNPGSDTLHQVTLRVADRAGSEVILEELGPIPPGEKSSLAGTINYSPRIYAMLFIEAFDSSHTFKDSVEIVQTWDGFPPVVLSEFLANPTDAISTEWVELWNRSDTTINIANWQISDANRVVTVSDSDEWLAPDEFIVLCNDTVEFALSYPLCSARVIRIASCPTFNNDGDTIRLIDEFGFVADSFGYTETFEDNRTWSRESFDPAEWGRSVDPGGTPGGENRVTIFEDGGNVSVRADSRQISSPGSTTIHASAPLGDSYTLKIFDRQGRVVRTLADDADFLAESYEWNGSSDSGERLPMGIYIVYFESTGHGSAKETIAIIR